MVIDKRLSTGNEWYVIQVPAGKEVALCETIRRAVGPDVLRECFTPRFATERKVRGAWEQAESLLLPGYIIAVTRWPVALYERLREVREFTKLLRMGGSFCPLAEGGSRLDGDVYQRGRPRDTHEHGSYGRGPRSGVPWPAQGPRGVHRKR